MNYKHSRLGISSTVLWIVVAICCLYFWSLTQDQAYIESLGVTKEEIEKRLLGLVFLIGVVSLIGTIISFILGLVGLRSKDKNILYAKIGAGLSIVTIIAVTVTFFALRG